MKLVRLILIINCALFVQFLSIAQHFELADSLTAKKISFFEVDALGQIYVVDSLGGIKLFTPEGKLKVKYHNVRLGDVQSLDVSNPFQILVFYSDFQAVEILDKSLSMIASLPLITLDIGRADALCFSNDLNLRVFDSVNGALLRFDRSGNIQQKTSNIFQLLGYSFNANKLEESRGQVYLFTSENKIEVFDIFGQHNTTIILDENNYNNIQVFNDNELYIFLNNQLIIKNKMDWTKFLAIDYPKSDIRLAKVQQTKLYLLQGDSIYTYNIIK
ncbi:MAG: hypothetical protein KA010_04375 [Saprospiraceae bacterium]|nr:hypothetical protein [Saprospiraceae bacterium]